MAKVKKYIVLILMLIDVMFINLSYICGLYFRFTTSIPVQYINFYKEQAIIITLIYIICFHIFKLYRSLWTFASVDELILSIGGCITGNILSMICSMLLGIKLPYTVSILAGVFSIIFIVGFRMSFRVLRRIRTILNNMDKSNFKRVLIVGAGATGTMILKEMNRHPEMKYNPVGFIDDSTYKKGVYISSVKVLGDRKSINKICKEKKIDIIVIAVHKLSPENKKELITLCNNTGCKVKIIPGVYELIGGKVSLSKMRDVDVKDLLGREQVKLDLKEISSYIGNRIVMVTGGGGSIGSELCRQISRFKPKELIIVDIYENNAYDIQNELKRKYVDLNLKVIIASVRDRKRIECIFETYKPEVVFHAAAHKHVPLMEFNPTEAIKNNVFGTLNVAECADKYKTKRFVMISTDKAVNPTNIMGATKRLCEMIVQAMNRVSNTEFVAVRFGNVLGSNGSVIPLFKKQIAEGGPVTVTDKEITRYFMLIPEAAQLVLQAGTFAKGGEIFVLDMGKPVKIYDLACDLIKLSGFEPNKDIKIEITGLRPGEKLYEELLMNEEGLKNTSHNKIFIGKPGEFDISEIKVSLKNMEKFVKQENNEMVIKQIEDLVGTYTRKTQELIAVSSEN